MLPGASSVFWGSAGNRDLRLREKRQGVEGGAGRLPRAVQATSAWFRAPDLVAEGMSSGAPKAHDDAVWEVQLHAGLAPRIDL